MKAIKQYAFNCSEDCYHIAITADTFKYKSILKGLKIQNFSENNQYQETLSETDSRLNNHRFVQGSKKPNFKPMCKKDN